MSKAKIVENKAFKEDDFKDLKFIKIIEPLNVVLIPKELIEEVKGRTFSINRFYEYQFLQAKMENPNNLLYILIDTKQSVKGFLWCEINGLDGSLFVNTFSISKEYWGKGEAISFVTDFLDKMVEKGGYPKVYWMTCNEKYFLKKGFKKSKNRLMEYQRAS